MKDNIPLTRLDGFRQITQNTYRYVLNIYEKNKHYVCVPVNLDAEK